jgi:hypothetical protein
MEFGIFCGKGCMSSIFVLMIIYYSFYTMLRWFQTIQKISLCPLGINLALTIVEHEHVHYLTSSAISRAFKPVNLSTNYGSDDLI